MAADADHQLSYPFGTISPMEPRTQRAIDEVARRQLGHLTTAQLLACGMSRATVRRHRLEGRLIQVGARTHRLGSAPVTSEGAALAACLDVDGVASHWTAAWLHGLVEALRHIEVSVVKGRSTKVMRPEGQRTVDVRIHTSTNLPPDDVIVVRGVPTTSVARTLLGLAALVPRELSQAELLEIVSRAVDRGLATDAWLWWILSKRRCRGRNGVIALETALSTRSELGPTESWLEREFLRILEEAGLPRPVTQRVIERHGRFAARVDFLHEPSASSSR